MRQTLGRPLTELQLPRPEAYPWDLIRFDSPTAAAIAAVVRDVALKSRPIRPRALELREVETRFFVPQNAVTTELANSPKIQIVQYYFPKELVPFMLRLTMELKGIAELPQSMRKLKFRNARIRHEVYPNGEEVFTLDVKAGKFKRGVAPRIVRPNLPVEIDAAMYAKLLPLATAGGIAKDRHLVKRMVDYRGQKCFLTAEIDRIVRIGPRVNGQPRDSVASVFNFVTVDLEMRGYGLWRSIRDHKHNFGFLNDGVVEINGCKKWVRRALSNRRVAASGHDDTLKKAIRRLNRGIDKAMQETAKQTKSKGKKAERVSA